MDVSHPARRHALVVIIGAGEIGRAIGGVLQKQKRGVAFWDKNRARVKNQKPLAAILPSADFLFFCVSSRAMRKAVEHALPFLRGDTVVVSLAKGIEEKTRATMDAVLASVLPRKQPRALLGGPLVAEELNRGMGGIGVIGATGERARIRLEQLFAGSAIRVECSGDMRGVALAGVLKNIYATALGIADGLGWGENKKGWLASVAAEEMAALGERLGGRKETAYGTAGLGDLLATGYSSSSHNRRVGEALVRSRAHNIVSEGAISLPSVVSLLGRAGRQFPLLGALAAVLVRRKSARATFQRFAAKKQ